MTGGPPVRPSHGFWRAKRVLVTGHTGFKGSWLCLWLNAMGAHTAGYSAGVPTAPGLFELAHVAEGVAHTSGDIRDLAALEGAVRAHRPEVLIHMAAQPLVRRSYRHPAETFAVNATGTANAVEALRRAGGVRAAVIVTTDKVYAERDPAGRGAGAPFTEGDRLGGADPYSASKACAELVVAAYRSSFFSCAGSTALASARAGNVIGGGDWGEDRLVPDLLRAAVTGNPVELRHPDSVRPWQHVLNPLNGYLALAEALWEEPALAGPWNFGPRPTDERPVRWMVERLGELWGSPIPWEQARGEHPHEAPVLRLDSSKAAERLGWTPRWDLEQGLSATVRWHRQVQAGADPRTLCLEQIAEFESAATGPVEVAPEGAAPR